MRNRSQLTLFITNLAILVHCTPSHSAETAKQKEAIQKVVSKGVEYLLKVHKPGTDYTGGSKQMGTAALAGLAFLESGVDEKNPSMQNIIKYVWQVPATNGNLRSLVMPDVSGSARSARG